MEKCVILCKLKLKKDDGLGYDHSKTISIGPFSDHETAGEFMTEHLDNISILKEGLKVFVPDEIISIEGWEVADFFPAEYIACNWKDHENAVRGSYGAGPNFSHQ